MPESFSQAINVRAAAEDNVITVRNLLARPEQPPNSLDASGGSAFLNLLGAAEGALIRAAASTQTLGGFRKAALTLPNHRKERYEAINNLLVYTNWCADNNRYLCAATERQE
jgi:hypothetical protein